MVQELPKINMLHKWDLKALLTHTSVSNGGSAPTITAKINYRDSLSLRSRITEVLSSGSLIISGWLSAIIFAQFQSPKFYGGYTSAKNFADESTHLARN